jgi:hypothetical protein
MQGIARISLTPEGYGIDAVEASGHIAPQSTGTVRRTPVMRAALYSTVAIVVAVAPLQAKAAAPVTEAGARQIAEKLTYYLPKSIVDTGFLKVTAGTQRYELSVDIAPLLKNLKPGEFSISGLKPFVQYLTPQDDGTWKVEANDSFDVSGFFTAEGKKSDFTYVIDKFAFDGIFDPELAFARTANASLEKMRFSSRSGPSNVDLGIDSFKSDTRAENVANGVADMVSNFSAKGLSEVISDPNAGPVTITAGSLDGRAQIDKLGIAALRDLVVFALDKIKADGKTLTTDEDARLKALIKANVPFTENLAEDFHFRDVKVQAQGMQLGLSDVGYKLDFNGIKADTRVGFEFSVADPTIPAGLLPPGAEGAVPKSASVGVAVTGLNVEGMISYILEHADFTKTPPLTPEQSKEIDGIILPDGRMHLEFTNVAAKSDIYDVSLTGTMMVNPDDSEKPEADITITARDLDKTVNYLQANADKVPQFGQASFMLLMMKGFGKQEADGTMTWNVKVDRTGKVLVNGREMPH